MSGVVDDKGLDSRKGRVLYVGSADVALGTGPGVNEIDFVLALAGAMGPRAQFVIPEPSSRDVALPDGCRFAFPHKRHSPWRYPVHMVSQAMLTHRELRRRHYDLVVIRLDVLPGLLYAVLRFHDIPYVLKSLGHGELTVFGTQGGILGRILDRPNRVLIRKMALNALVVDCPSKAMLNYHRDKTRIPANQLMWIDNAVNLNRFASRDQLEVRKKLGLVEYNPIVGYVGSRPAERGAGHLVEAGPELVKHFPRLGILVVGDGPRMQGLRERARSLGIEARCRFEGYVPFARVPDYIYALDVGVSINSRADRYRAAELKVRQYISAGRPVVASPGGNDFVRAEDLGTIVDASDNDAIKNALLEWLSLGNAEREAFRQKASRFAKKSLSVERALEVRLERWEQLLETRLGRRIKFL